MKAPDHYASKAEELLQEAEKNVHAVAQGVSIGTVYSDIARTYVDLAAVSASLIPIEEPQ